MEPESKRAGEMPPDNAPPRMGFTDNPPPYSTVPQGGAPPDQVPLSAMPQPQPAPQIIQAVPIRLQQQMGPNPANIVCHSCNQQMVTRVEQKAVMKTHLFALILCLVGCWPCACIPYCMDSCMSTEHYCTNCNAYIGSYNA